MRSVRERNPQYQMQHFGPEHFDDRSLRKAHLQYLHTNPDLDIHYSDSQYMLQNQKFYLLIGRLFRKLRSL